MAFFLLKMTRLRETDAKKEGKGRRVKRDLVERQL